MEGRGISRFWWTELLKSVKGFDEILCRVKYMTEGGSDCVCFPTVSMRLVFFLEWPLTLNETFKVIQCNAALQLGIYVTVYRQNRERQWYRLSFGQWGSFNVSGFVGPCFDREPAMRCWIVPTYYSTRASHCVSLSLVIRKISRDHPPAKFHTNDGRMTDVINIGRWAYAFISHITSYNVGLERSGVCVARGP